MRKKQIKYVLGLVILLIQVIKLICQHIVICFDDTCE